MYWPVDDWAAIVIDPSLSRQERNAALAHELVHDERGGGCPDHPDMPPGWGAVVCRHENNVQAEVVRRLVPLDELERFCEARATFGLVDVLEVAEEFDVPATVAARALQVLNQSRAA